LAAAVPFPAGSAGPLKNLSLISQKKKM
jgi:hypothetical protein